MYVSLLKFKLFALSMVLAGASLIASAQTPAPSLPTVKPTDKPLTAFPYTPGLDVAAMDKTADPCVDFYQYTCGGWMRTGDAAFVDKDGYFFVYDRVKDMIVTGGENVYPAEVENAVFGHPSVADVAVIGVPDDKWGEAVKAVVVLKPGAGADEASIIAWARQNVAAYKTPKSIDFVETIPRNASGKILRRELRKPYWEGRERMVG